jgi:hypothetical protein
MRKLVLSAALVASIVVFSILISSCESQSGQRARLILEKVVVIERHIVDGATSIRFKVKRISKGIVEFVNLPQPYAVGDTITYKF